MVKIISKKKVAALLMVCIISVIPMQLVSAAETYNYRNTKTWNEGMLFWTTNYKAEYYTMSGNWKKDVLLKPLSEWVFHKKGLTNQIAIAKEVSVSGNIQATVSSQFGGSISAEIVSIESKSGLSVTTGITITKTELQSYTFVIGSEQPSQYNRIECQAWVNKGRYKLYKNVNGVWTYQKTPNYMYYSRAAYIKLKISDS